MKKLSLIIMSLLILLSLSACSEESYDISKYDFAKLNNQEIDKVYTATGIYTAFNYDNIMELFPEFQSATNVNEGKENAPYAFDLEDKSLGFTTEIMNTSGFNYKSEYLLFDSIFYQTFITNKNSPHSNKENFLTDENLDFISIEELKDEFNKYLQNIGIDLTYDIEVYTLSHELMNSEREKVIKSYENLNEINPVDNYDISVIDTFTEEHDCYYIFASQELDNINISANTFGEISSGALAYGGEIEAIYTKDGFVRFSVSAPVMFENMEETEIISIEEATKFYEKKMSDIISQETIELDEITLKYYLEYRNEYSSLNIIPYWEFSQKVTSSPILLENGETFQFTHYTTVNFDAITGKEIITYTN